MCVPLPILIRDGLGWRMKVWVRDSLGSVVEVAGGYLVIT